MGCEGRGYLERDTKEISGMMIMFYILIEIWITLALTVIKPPMYT